MIVAGHVNMAKQTSILDHKFLVLTLEFLMDMIAAARVTMVNLPRMSWIRQRITERFLSRETG